MPGEQGLREALTVPLPDEAPRPPPKKRLGQELAPASLHPGRGEVFWRLGVRWRWPLFGGSVCVHIPDGENDLLLAHALFRAFGKSQDLLCLGGNGRNGTGVGLSKRNEEAPCWFEQ